MKPNYDIIQDENIDQDNVISSSNQPPLVGVAENEYVRQPNDPVIINDPSPVIVLFGSGASGKTMTLIRLTKYLIAQGYKVKPERTFCDARDKHYQRMCDNFMSIVGSTKAPGRNQVIDFMLVKVEDAYGRPICQLLEAPGEHYFDPKYPTRDFPTYLATITVRPNRKTWVIIVEKDWMNQEDRNHYAEKIVKLQENHINPKDKVIFTCHKVDKHFVGWQQANVRQLLKDIWNDTTRTGQYPNIFSQFKNTNIITKLWRKYDFDFVPFSAGLFTDDGNGGQNYIQGDDKYPIMLWKSIMKTIKGGW